MIDLQQAGHLETFERLSTSSAGAPVAYLATARETLDDMLRTPDLLDGIDLHRVDGEYTRNLVFGDDRITILAIVWAPGAATAIHDHHCSCCFGMLSGTLQEDWFTPVDDTHAVKFRTLVRHPRDVVCMLPTGHNLHRMSNQGSQESISLHIYGYGCHARPSSIHRECRLHEQPSTP